MAFPVEGLALAIVNDVSIPRLPVVYSMLLVGGDMFYREWGRYGVRPISDGSRPISDEPMLFNQR